MRTIVPGSCSWLVFSFLELVLYLQLGTAAHLRPGVFYRIHSGLDGNVLTAHDPSFANDLKLRLGAVTVEDWYNGKNQLWELEEREVYIPEEKAELSSGGSSSVNKTTTTEITKGKETVYFVRAKSAVLNFVTGIPKEAENLYRITEIVKDSETYLIQNVETGMCLKNPGNESSLGIFATFSQCNELDPTMQWDFEDPRFISKLAFFFNKLMLLNHSNNAGTNGTSLRIISTTLEKAASR